MENEKAKKSNSMSILSTSHLVKQYGQKENLVKALNDVSISIEEGEFVAIIGTSGSGKSTLLNMLGGLDRPTSGSVQVDGVTLDSMSDDALTVFRRQKIGFIFQNYNLVPILNVYENIVMPIQLDGRQPDNAFVDEITSLLGLNQKLYNMPNNLSGGQQQRVAIARALASKPAIILADEPTVRSALRTAGFTRILPRKMLPSRLRNLPRRRTMFRKRKDGEGNAKSDKKRLRSYPQTQRLGAGSLPRRQSAAGVHVKNVVPAQF